MSDQDLKKRIVEWVELLGAEKVQGVLAYKGVGFSVTERLVRGVYESHLNPKSRRKVEAALTELENKAS